MSQKFHFLCLVSGLTNSTFYISLPVPAGQLPLSSLLLISLSSKLLPSIERPRFFLLHCNILCIYRHLSRCVRTRDITFTWLHATVTRYRWRLQTGLEFRNKQEIMLKRVSPKRRRAAKCTSSAMTYIVNISFLFTSPSLSCFPQPGRRVLNVPCSWMRSFGIAAMLHAERPMNRGSVAGRYTAVCVLHSALTDSEVHPVTPV